MVELHGFKLEFSLLLTKPSNGTVKRGGRLTMSDDHRFSQGPLRANLQGQQRRDNLYYNRFSDASALFSLAVNGNVRPLQEAVLYFIQLTRQL